MCIVLLPNRYRVAAAWALSKTFATHMMLSHSATNRDMHHQMNVPAALDILVDQTRVRAHRHTIAMRVSETKTLHPLRGQHEQA